MPANSNSLLMPEWPNGWLDKLIPDLLAAGRSNAARRLAAKRSGGRPASCQALKGNTDGTDSHRGETENRGRQQDGGRPPLRRRVAQDGRLLACLELSVRRSDLPARQPPLEKATQARAHQAAPARPLGHVARAEYALRPSQPG